MAIVLSKKRESSGRIALRKIARVVVSRYAMGLAVFAVGSAAFGLGVLSGRTAEPVPPIIHAKPVEALDALDEADTLSQASRTLVAAVLAHQREEGRPPESLDVLYPVYLASEPDPAWQLDGQSVRRLVTDAGVCGALGIDNTDASPAIDAGTAGLRCFRTLEGEMFAHRLVDEPVQATGMVHLVVRGQIEDRLLTWSVRSVPVGPDEPGVSCDPLSSAVKEETPAAILLMNSAVETRYCVPVFEGELEPIHRVMSLTQGEGNLVVSGKSLGRAWSLHVATAMCNEQKAQGAVRLRLGEQPMMPVQCIL